MKFVPILFWLLALVHLAPAVAAISPNQIATLYGIEPANKTLLTLLQHRAILLGLVGVAFAYAAFKPAFRWPVLCIGAASMALFISFCVLNGQLSSSLGRIAIIDAISLGIAAVAAYLILKSKKL